MQVTKLMSYMMMSGDQFPVQLSLIQSSELIDMVKNSSAGTFNRTYSDLNEKTLSNKFKTNFNGLDLYSAVRSAIFYTAISDGQTLGDTTMRDTYLGLLQIKSANLVTRHEAAGPYTVEFSWDSLTALSGTAYHRSVNLTHQATGFYNTNSVGITKMAGATLLGNYFTFTIAQHSGFMDFYVIPDDFLLNGYVNPAYEEKTPLVTMRVNFYVDNMVDHFTYIQFDGVQYVEDTHWPAFFAGIKFPDAAQDIDDPDNPYGDPGTSGPGGGDGGYGDPDEVDPTAVPDLPTASAASTGFITIYNPTNANLTSLGNYLWSSAFDLNTFKKMYADPMECIISLGIVPCLPNSGGTRNIYFGNIDTGINCTFLSSQYAKVDCGSVNITKYVGSFMDYSPYVKVNLFLPYIGFIHLGTDDIMGGSINVTYHVDVLSGDCIAFITHSSKGVLYSYTGNCLTNVPVTAANYASSLRNYYEAVMGIIPSTANGAMSGGAAGAAAGAMSGALSAASNIVLNTKPDFQRSGSLGGSSGIMGVQKPFIIIERPNISVPNKVQHYMGQTSNMTASLGGLSGMTIVEAVHLEGIPCTTSELAEIESILHQGVIL